MCTPAVRVLSIELPLRSNQREVSGFLLYVTHTITHPGTEMTDPVLQISH